MEVSARLFLSCSCTQLLFLLSLFFGGGGLIWVNWPFKKKLRVHSPAPSSHWGPSSLTGLWLSTLQLRPLPVVFHHRCEPEQTTLHRDRTAETEDETEDEEYGTLWETKKKKEETIWPLGLKCTTPQRIELSFGSVKSTLTGEQRAIRASFTGWWLNLSSLCTPHSWLDGTNAADKTSNMRVHRCVGVSQQSPLLFKPNSNHFNIETIASGNRGQAQTGRCPAGERRDRVGGRGSE